MNSSIFHFNVLNALALLMISSTAWAQCTSCGDNPMSGAHNPNDDCYTLSGSTCRMTLGFPDFELIDTGKPVLGGAIIQNECKEERVAMERTYSVRNAHEFEGSISVSVGGSAGGRVYKLVNLSGNFELNGELGYKYSTATEQTTKWHTDATFGQRIQYTPATTPSLYRVTTSISNTLVLHYTLGEFIPTDECIDEPFEVDIGVACEPTTIQDMSTIETFEVFSVHLKCDCKN